MVVEFLRFWFQSSRYTGFSIISKIVVFENFSKIYRNVFRKRCPIFLSQRPFSYLAYIFASLIPSNKGNSLPVSFSGDAFPLNLYYTLKHSAFSQLLLLFFPPSYSTTNPNSPVFLCFAWSCSCFVLPVRSRLRNNPFTLLNFATWNFFAN